MADKLTELAHKGQEWDKALKPCPFCGGSASVEFDEFGESNWHTVMCMECYAAGPEKESHAEAIATWNTRAPVRAKQLEWRGPFSSGGYRKGKWIAEFYTISRLDVDQYTVRWPRAGKNPWPSLEEAQAAAQEDFQRRFGGMQE